MWEKPPEGIWKPDFPLPCDHPVRKEWETAFDQALGHLRHGAPRVYAPNRLSRLTKAANGLEECQGHRRGFRGIMKSPIEIKGQQQGWLRAGV